MTNETPAIDEEDPDRVLLTSGYDYQDSEMIDRSALPDHAFETAMVVDGEHVEGVPGRKYRVWAIEE